MTEKITVTQERQNVPSETPEGKREESLQTIKDSINESLGLIGDNPDLLKNMGISRNFSGQLRKLLNFIEDPLKTKNMGQKTLKTVKEGVLGIYTSFTQFTENNDNKQQARFQIQKSVEIVKNAIKFKKWIDI